MTDVAARRPEVVVIVEGKTERTFVQNQLAAHLSLLGIDIWPVGSGKQRHRGGVRKWPGAKADIVHTLKENRHCSTMFDYYGMPMDWPGRAEAVNRPWNERAAIVEERIQQDVFAEMGGSFDTRFFMPYVQLHEFEALAFANVDELVGVVATNNPSGADTLRQAFAEILRTSGSAEAINDGRDTSPSHRILKLVPEYDKVVHGPTITTRIGLQTLRQRCPHFGQWLSRLEQIGESQRSPT